MKKKILFNKKIFYNYKIIKTLNAGLVLKGWEIKSIRSNNVNIENSYISIYKKNIFLMNFKINILKSHYKYINYEKYRKIKLLLKKNEILYLLNKIKKDNLTIIPIHMFWKKFLCKLKIGLSKGIKKIDKRYIKKKREWQIKKLRIIKNFK
ncbi:SsrA-binding protein SmpB [Buchnera aphidicola (Ceratoglyphina bambusae)]|uniref:SsrA-binding protein SmpB n=1 Tax=Buchnera aphidicola TaxID=9 RepID=UPI0031B88A99